VAISVSSVDSVWVAKFTKASFLTNPPSCVVVVVVVVVVHNSNYSKILY
jgi:hypothetical protein